ncbi:hypothetical protein EI94DRAFT_1096764 [Lactarius quietus]|nr:hypothetical protein EI94DRAFT_1096764 [Lactarius quietus]
MASIQADESISATQSPSDNTPNIPQQGVVTQIPSPPLVDLHTHHEARTSLTRASAGPLKPQWLLPSSRPNRSTSLSVSTSRGINPRPTSRADPARPCVPETAQPPLHDASPSVSASAVLAGCSASAERAGKRKVADEEPPRRDKVLRCTVASTLGRGSSMFLGSEESERIMRNTKDIRAAKQGRRVTVAAGGVPVAKNPKRAKRASSVDDDDTDAQLTWKRKIPAVSRSVSGLKRVGVGATSAASGIKNTNGSGLGAFTQELPSGKLSV